MDYDELVWDGFSFHHIATYHHQSINKYFNKKAHDLYMRGRGNRRKNGRAKG